MFVIFSAGKCQIQSLTLEALNKNVHLSRSAAFLQRLPGITFGYQGGSPVPKSCCRANSPSKTATLQLLHNYTNIMNCNDLASSECRRGFMICSFIQTEHFKLSLLWQGAKKMTFQLEVWNKTEDVVQTLLQVRSCLRDGEEGLRPPLSQGHRSVFVFMNCFTLASLYLFNCSAMC